MRATEEFWAGEFGNEYTQRNVGRVDINRRFFTRAMASCKAFASVIEFGAGSGENLLALGELMPANLVMTGMDINYNAYIAMQENLKDRRAPWCAINKSFLDMIVPTHDMSMTKGVLIHIAPEDLHTAYNKLYEASRRYILIAEYFSAAPREIEYRGHTGRLWTRDYGGEMQDQHPDLKLLDVTFHYNRTTGQDNITAWLFEKINEQS